MSEIILPKQVENELNQTARSVPRGDRTRVFIGLPNMISLNTGLVAKLFAFAMSKKVDPWFHFLSEKRHADFARNQLAKLAIENKSDWLLMIDADVDPHPNLLDMVDRDLDIMSGNVFCWINGQLMPSIWQKAACEQCFCLKKFMEEGIVHDASQYRVTDKILERWNPFTQSYHPFATREGIIGSLQCRCKGTKLDPFVFQTHQQMVGAAQLMEVDSVGSAAMLIRVPVFDKIPFPWFQFLYREDRSIMLTEDHFFCWKAGMHGFKIHADPQMVCSHFKTVNLLEVHVAMQKAYALGQTKPVATALEPEVMQAVK